MSLTKQGFLAIGIFWLFVATLIQSSFAKGDGDLVTTDYFITHRSIEPFYKQYSIDPYVVIRVREVILAGRERTVPKDGQVLLLVHGGASPAVPAFDLDHANTSMMRYLARAGWDTFALDIEGYGASTRPLVMDAPAAFPKAKAPIRSAVAVNNIERVVDFIRSIRGVEKVHLLGWSRGATTRAPLYAIRHPNKVAKLVLYAGVYKSLGFAEPFRKTADALYDTAKIRVGAATLKLVKRFGAKKEFLIPGALKALREANLATDPRSGELRGRYRSPGGDMVDLLRTKVQFDAAKIKVPTLVIRGANDTLATHEDGQQLLADLGSEHKQYVAIPNGSHFMQFETVNMQFFEAVKTFLESKTPKKATSQ